VPELPRSHCFPPGAVFPPCATAGSPQSPCVTQVHPRTHECRNEHDISLHSHVPMSESRQTPPRSHRGSAHRAGQNTRRKQHAALARTLSRRGHSTGRPRDFGIPHVPRAGPCVQPGSPKLGLGRDDIAALFDRMRRSCTAVAAHRRSRGRRVGRRSGGVRTMLKSSAAFRAEARR